MTITVETGAGVTGANSYASVADLRAYAIAGGSTVPNSSTECEALLIRAMRSMRGLNYKGRRVTRDQPLDFPRTGVDVEGSFYESTRLPPQLKDAQCVLALAAQKTDLTPTIPANTSGPVTSKTVGPLSVTYANVGSTRRTPFVTEAEELLGKLTIARGAFAIRA